MVKDVHLGFSIPDGAPVRLPLRHMVVTGQTQEAGKTTALEAMIARGGVKAITFVTKRGEGSFRDARRIDPYFREQADWQFVASILEASRGEKLKFERGWIIRASKGARTLADVQANIKKAMESAKGLSADVYLCLNAYLDVVVPQIAEVEWATSVNLKPGVNAMDLSALAVEMQHLVIRSTIRWVLEHDRDTVVVIPEAWKFIPQGRGTPVKLAAEEFIRQGAAMGNYLWLDSQDIAGIDKLILKSIPVWVLGVQRESNEIKRTLDQIPTGTKKPKPEAIATLGLGQFFPCWGVHVIKTYVQPIWMDDTTAKEIAMGLKSLSAVNRKPEPKKDEAMTDDMNNRLDKLTGVVENLAASMSSMAKGQASQPHVVQSSPQPVMIHNVVEAPEAIEPKSPKKSKDAPKPFDEPEVEDLYQRFRSRLMAEAPKLIRILAVEPEIHIQPIRDVIEVNLKELKGMIATLLFEGFLDDGLSATAVHKECERRWNYGGNQARAYEQLDMLTSLGFTTIENGARGKLYKAVAIAKARIKVAA